MMDSIAVYMLHGFIVLGAVLLFFFAGPPAPANICEVVAGALRAGCRPADEKSACLRLNSGGFNATNAFIEIKALVAIRPRHSGSPGAQKAAEHLLARLRATGIDASLDEFEEETPVGKIIFRNVIGILPGKDKGFSPATTWIIIGAHYDTKSGISDNFEGANDSGSGAGVLLELARVIKNSLRVPAAPAEALCDLSRHPVHHSAMRDGGSLPATAEGRANILLAFFDGEECVSRYAKNDGLHGSRRLAEQFVKDGRAAKVGAVIILDMVGDKDLHITIPRNSALCLVSALFAAAKAEGTRDKFTLWLSEILDDHQPFLSAGMPAIDVIDFEYGSARGRNDYWHTPEDTLDKLSIESIEIVGKTAWRLLNDLMRIP